MQPARPLNAVEAVLHLRERMKAVGDASKQPHWTKADAAAVTILLDLPARPEQIALARIEGIARNSGYVPDNLRTIYSIAAKALGL